MKEKLKTSAHLKISRNRKKGEAKQLLHELEAMGRYVFHGSPTSEIQELEPRQAFDYSTGVQKKHGDPSVSATPYADIAIFRAVVHMGTTGFGKIGNELKFQATQRALDLAREAVGFVYVLEKEGFRPFGANEENMEWRSSQSQRTIKLVPVTFDDLPEGIAIIAPLEGKEF